MKTSRDSAWRRERGRAFQAEGAAKEKAREPTVDRLMRGVMKRRESEAEQRDLEGVHFWRRSEIDRSKLSYTLVEKNTVCT